MVKSERPWTGGVILAAVDVGNQDEDHRRLHASIIDHGFEIAKLAKGELHVISAHPSPMLSASDPAYQLSETIESVTARRAKRSRPSTTLAKSVCM